MMLRGLDKNKSIDVHARGHAIRAMEQQELQRTRALKLATGPSNQSMSALISNPAWTSIGPAPLPNGQVNGPSSPVSGRVSAIAVDPRNEKTIYVGAAQGGVYRSLDGGSTWTPLMDNALSLSIGAIAIAPSHAAVVVAGDCRT